MVIDDLAITGLSATFEPAAYLRAKVLNRYHPQTPLFGSFNHSGVALARLCSTNMVGKTL